jgi:hypothetical protein
VFAGRGVCLDGAVHWEFVERASWFAAIIGTLLAFVSSWLAGRAQKNSMRDFTRMMALLTDNPQLLEAVEADARKRQEIVRRRVRTTWMVAAVTFLLALPGFLLVLASQLIGTSIDPMIVGGDRPTVTSQCLDAGETDVCTPVYRYDLSAAGSQTETRYVAEREDPMQGKGRMDARAEGCDGQGQVELRVSVDGSVVTEVLVDSDGASVEFNVASGQEFTLTARRVNSGTCGPLLRLERFFVTFD